MKSEFDCIVSTIRAARDSTFSNWSSGTMPFGLRIELKIRTKEGNNNTKKPGIPTLQHVANVAQLESRAKSARRKPNCPLLVFKNGEIASDAIRIVNWGYNFISDWWFRGRFFAWCDLKEVSKKCNYRGILLHKILISCPWWKGNQQ